ncbi:hypothetical protein [Methylobacterium trifolii]|uniref:Uncharacterized protein n=1 Tax=Methylobacterium trifolii TaxID=1003092 RepID=A0ABQ4U0C1_9HYPH|nr:hypothetical protein [Methylobacterium trifolii]GJE60925.1 hypothetical protein MPOCJGCO_3044 [Methylobacterium trifolii]
MSDPRAPDSGVGTRGRTPDGTGLSAEAPPCGCGSAPSHRAHGRPTEPCDLQDPQAWIRFAYPEADDPSLIDAPRFTRWDMEVAFMAGRLAALLPATPAANTRDQPQAPEPAPPEAEVAPCAMGSFDG